jgi:hypothetical protein
MTTARSINMLFSLVSENSMPFKNWSSSHRGGRFSRNSQTLFEFAPFTPNLCLGRKDSGL